MDKENKKVLIFIDWFLPGSKAGGPVTSNVNMVEEFRDEVDFFILTRNTDYCEETPYESVPANQWTQFKEGVSIFYFSNDFLTISNLKKVTEEARCDHWYINGVYSMYFSILPLILSQLNKDIRTTISARGMLSPHALTEKSFKKKLLLGVFKWFGMYRDVFFHATNTDEAADIAKQVSKSKGILIAPNLSKKSPFGLGIKEEKISGSLKLISLARISPEKNILGALEILVNCMQHSIQFDIYGQIYDQDYGRRCQEAIKMLPKTIEVNFHGSISPQEVPAALSKSHYLFLPTQGENFGHAILEALSAGCPVIISDRTPWRDLQEKGIGWDISLDQPDQFIKAIESAVAMDQESYAKMSKAAIEFGKDFTENTEVIDANRKLFGI